MPFRDLTDWDYLMLFDIEDQQRQMRKQREEVERAWEENIRYACSDIGGVREPYSEEMDTGYYRNA